MTFPRNYAGQQFTNRFQSEIAIALTDSPLDNTIVLKSGDGAKLPALNYAEDFMMLTLFATQSDGTEYKWEEVYVYNVSGDSLQVIRGMEESTPQIWPIGTKIEMRATRNSMYLIEPYSTYSTDAPNSQYIDGYWHVNETEQCVYFGFRGAEEYPDLTYLSWQIRPAQISLGSHDTTFPKNSITYLPHYGCSRYYFNLVFKNIEINLLKPVSAFGESSLGSILADEREIAIRVFNNSYILSIVNFDGLPIYWENGSVCPCVSGGHSVGDYYIIKASHRILNDLGYLIETGWFLSWQKWSV